MPHPRYVCRSHRLLGGEPVWRCWRLLVWLLHRADDRLRPGDVALRMVFARGTAPIILRSRLANGAVICELRVHGFNGPNEP